MGSKKYSITIILLSTLLLLLFFIMLFIFVKERFPVAFTSTIEYNKRSGAGISYEDLGDTEEYHTYEIVRFHIGEQTSYGRLWIEAKDQEGNVFFIVRDGSGGQNFLDKGEYLQMKAQNVDMPEWKWQKDEAWENTLLQFPTSYHEALNKIHVLYPQWTFAAVSINYEWEYALEKELEPESKNLVQFDDTEYFFGKEWMKKNDTLYEAPNWYPASREAIAYHMDPRNFLNSRDVFQFLKLRYGEHNGDNTAVKAIFAGIEALDTFVDPVMIAAKEADILPEALATRIRQELSLGDDITMGAKGMIHPDQRPLIEDSASPGFLSPEDQLRELETLKAQVGKLSEEQEKYYQDLKNGGTGYPEPKERYYNLFNIAAFPDPGETEGSLYNGARFAAGLLMDRVRMEEEELMLPWDSIERAMIGGAKFIKGQYIAGGQDSLYLQKFDLLTGNFSHQYMQAIQTPQSEGRRLYNVFASSERLEEPWHFEIPIFQNMPTEAAPAGKK